MVGWMLLFGAVAALVAYTTLATMVAYRLTHPRRRYPTVEPSAVGLRYEDVWFQARGESLTITAWHLPAAGATRAIIVAHGVGGCRGKEFTVRSLDLMKHLVESGFTLLVLDLRGHGESDRAAMTFGIRERRDLLGAVDWLLARGYAPGQIGVLGASMGGVAGIGAAGEEPAIGAIVIDSSCANFLAMMRQHFRRQTRLPLFFLPGTLLVGRMLIGENLAGLRPAADLRAIERRPVLVIHARGDRVVPVAHGRALAMAAKGEFWMTSSTRHLGSYEASAMAYSDRVTQFFTTSLQQPNARASALSEGEIRSEQEISVLSDAG